MDSPKADPQQGPPPGLGQIQFRLPDGSQPSPEQIQMMQQQIAQQAQQQGLSIPEFIAKMNAQNQARLQAQQGQQPSPEQIQAMQKQLAQDAEKAGMSVPEFVAKIKAQQAQQQALQQGQQPSPEQIQAMQKQLAQDAEKAGMSVPEFVAKIKAQQAQQQALQQGPPPSPEQVQAMKEKLAQDAAKAGMTVPEFVEKIKADAMAQQQKQREAAMAQQQQQQPQPIQPGPPNPAAIALANFLMSQDLKARTCILNGQRKNMFKVKRALRAIQSPAYEKARKKNPLLPKLLIAPHSKTASNFSHFRSLHFVFLKSTLMKVMIMHLRVKGLWTVKIEQQQECKEELHFVWLYEGAQIKQKLYAAGALAIVFAIVMFPLWPMKMRLGVWYLSMGMLGLLGLFFAMAIFRLILFGITMFAVPPGLWLYPNLFEDVGFFDSFRPVWGWQEEKKKGKKKSKSSASASANAIGAAMTGQPAPASATTTGSTAQISTGETTQRNLTPRVEEVFDEE
ncbi:putative translocation protein sec62 protein [Botrytis fragariae]|uniref:Translocation protein SEC62 n=1 Tax=Botrytis fragariae TaxID=1964551 RepID=A0A8H6EJL0_9HELO|nr:putative translocation protein sec62 protein [Botrytis fragariae]KAF5874637.1 putative translocation protein sec62 protein [Botrytis fragariae]